MRSVRWMAVSIAALLLAACEGDPTPLDAGPIGMDGGSDADALDAGSDAGALDAGALDAALTDAGATDAGSDAGWEMLFNGVDLSGIGLHVTTEDEITIVDGELRCGEGPNGYWYTEGSYANYVLELEWRFERPADLAVDDDESFPGNSGYLMHMSGEHRVWPACVEVQGMNRDVGQIFAIGGAAFVTARQDGDARFAARNPVGEWNHLRIFSEDGAFRVELNDVPVGDSDPGPLRSGPIGFQCEGAPIGWRNVRLRRLP